jgi:hypothetical protein
MAKTATSKGRDILSKKDKFPDFNILDYETSLRDNLKFYNVEIDDNKKKKAWAIDYWRSEDKDVKHIAKLSDGYFTTVGAVAHMIRFREIELDENQHEFLDRKYEELKSRTSSSEQEAEQPDTGTDTSGHRQAAGEMYARSCIGEFLGGIDDFFQGKSFDSKSYLIKNQIKPNVTKRISDTLKGVLREVKLAQAGKDEQLNEGYSFLTKRQLTKFADYIQSMIDSCEVASAITKATRSPRAKKQKPPTEIVKNLKYMTDDSVSKLKSEHPSKIVGSNEVWVYNSKTRRLFRYVALNGMTISVKGTTLINIDAEKSGGKIIRKPETQLNGVQNMTTRPLNKLFNEIRGTESRATGRINEDVIIVRCL